MGYYNTVNLRLCFNGVIHKYVCNLSVDSGVKIHIFPAKRWIGHF